MTPLLEVDRVSKTYNVPGMKEPYCVFRDISLQIREGEFVSVIGHSGCGKSALLNIIAGIDHADEGVILLKGREVSSRRWLSRKRGQEGRKRLESCT